MVHEHHLTVSRTARFYTLGEPGPAVRDVWIVCHGYGQMAASFVRRFVPVAAPERLVVAPEALARFYLDRAHGGSHAASAVGASWMTREDRAAEIADQVAYLDALSETILSQVDRAHVRTTALGFSQGAATVWRWLAHSAVRVDRVICWGAVVPDDVRVQDARSLRQASICLVTGNADEFATAERLAHASAQLAAAGVPSEQITFEGGHRLDDATLRHLAGALTAAATGPPAFPAGPGDP